MAAELPWWKKVLFHFLSEIDPLDVVLTERQERQNFVKSLVSRHKLKGPGGKKLTPEYFDKALRYGYRAKIAGYSSSTSGMADNLYEHGSKAFGNENLQDLGYSEWATRMGARAVSESAIETSDHVSLSSSIPSLPARELSSIVSVPAAFAGDLSNDTFKVKGEKRQIQGCSGLEQMSQSKRRKNTETPSTRKLSPTPPDHMPKPRIETNVPTNFNARHPDAHLDEVAPQLLDLANEAETRDSSKRKSIELAHPEQVRSQTTPDGASEIEGPETPQRSEALANSSGARKTPISEADTVPIVLHGAGTHIVSPGEVGEEMTFVWRLITRFLDALPRGTQFGTCRHESLDMEADNEMVAIYQTLFGERWARTSSAVIQAEICGAQELIQACTAAALWRSVWNKALPWKGLKTFLKENNHIVERANRAIQASSQSDVKAIFLKAFFGQMRAPDFQNQTILPIAEDLTANFMHSMTRQLAIVAATKMAHHGGSRPSQTRFIEQIFHRALLLKGKLDATPDQYWFEWVQRGEQLDRNGMEEVTETVGEQVVAWCASPKVMCIYQDANEPVMVVKPKVYAMPVQRPDVKMRGANSEMVVGRVSHD